MKNRVNRCKRAALGLAAGLAASLSLPGEAQAAFTGPGVYVIKIYGTGDVLDIEGNSTGIGQRLLRWGSNGGANQKFIVFASPDGGYVIRPLHSLRCLDLPGWSTAVGTDIVQYRCTGAGNQRFYIENYGRGALIRAVHGNALLQAWREGGPVELGSTRQVLNGMVFEFEPV